VIVDELSQARHGGEINVPLASGQISLSDVAGSLAEVITGAIPPRSAPDQITIFDSTGLAIEDIALAEVIYRRALEKKSGTQIHL
jgi:alanine dehydrogenase